MQLVVTIPTKFSIYVKGVKNMDNIQKMKATAVEELVQNNKAVLLDIRTPTEILEQEIPDSIVMPFDLVSADRIKDTVGTDKKVVFVCRSGSRAIQAAQAVAGAVDSAVLDGGIIAWSKTGLPLKEGRKIIPLDRQVLITLGTLLLITLLLSYTVSSAFLFIVAFFGAGMIFAGVTGNCGMARVLLLMPWNRTPLCSSGTCGAASKRQ
ncbi:rhodanese-like domain-containing protein [Halodesulfovibrio sp.]|uniref:rhodanese-like domain-containing protein n=2 Tax=Halodesulfovibrio sp. TaxID=1912772 RepID=UPI0025E9A848|nr:rhodanese-like domain-containing protein [Halodesulfovibrio sp.]MCT4628111.1 rhodanese-like domain-containing protein [Halodesulfovibrio sp.]